MITLQLNDGMHMSFYFQQDPYLVKFENINLFVIITDRVHIEW